MRVSMFLSLLVMGILALVLGVGVGVFARLDFSERTVVAELEVRHGLEALRPVLGRRLPRHRR